MKIIDKQTKMGINGLGKTKSNNSKGFAWDKFAMFSVISSIGVSFATNILNIVNSAQRKSPSTYKYIGSDKIFGSANNLNSNFF